MLNRKELRLLKSKLRVSSFAIALLMLFLSACGAPSGEADPETADPAESLTYETVLRDPNGMPIPDYSDVNRSVLEPALFFKDEKGRMQYDDPSVRLYTGIDVSSFQGTVDWDAVREDGIDFVMLRAGGRGWAENGLMYEDDMFRKNCADAAEAGLKVGAYFFSQATNEAEAEEEARFLLGIIKDCPLTYPVAFDWEHVDDNPDARTNAVSDEMLTACAVRFCDVIREGGFEPIIYFNRKLGYFFYDLSIVKTYDFWLAEFADAPAFIYQYKMWQYSDSGSVDGISGIVDLNISLYDFSQTVKK